MVIQGNPEARTPLPPEWWGRSTMAERLGKVENILAPVIPFLNDLKVLRAEADGRVILHLSYGGHHGALLMRLEALVQREIPGIILLETPLGDANKLRLFRGVHPK